MGNTNTASVLSIVSLADVTAKIDAKNAAERELKDLMEMAEMDAAKIKANPQYVAGSVRLPTAEDKAALGSHLTARRVGDIKCTACGEVFVVNAGDLHQCKVCDVCKPEAKKAAGKVKRAGKRLAKVGGSLETIEATTAATVAKIAELKARLAAKS